MAERYIRIHLHCDNIYDNIPDSERLVPFGDNFYGVVLTFSLAQPETYFIDQTYWED